MLNVAFAYATGATSSREIGGEIAFRRPSANEVPNYRSTGRFRRRQRDALHLIVLQGLRLCNGAGLVRLGASP